MKSFALFRLLSLDYIIRYEQIFLNGQLRKQHFNSNIAQKKLAVRQSRTCDVPKIQHFDHMLRYLDSLAKLTNPCMKLNCKLFRLFFIHFLSLSYLFFLIFSLMKIFRPLLECVPAHTLGVASYPDMISSQTNLARPSLHWPVKGRSVLNDYLIGITSFWHTQDKRIDNEESHRCGVRTSISRIRLSGKSKISPRTL